LFVAFGSGCGAVGCVLRVSRRCDVVRLLGLVVVDLESADSTHQGHAVEAASKASCRSLRGCVWRVCHSNDRCSNRCAARAFGSRLLGKRRPSRQRHVVSDLRCAIVSSSRCNSSPATQTAFRPRSAGVAAVIPECCSHATRRRSREGLYASDACESLRAVEDVCVNRNDRARDFANKGGRERDVDPLKKNGNFVRENARFGPTPSESPRAKTQ
jgi:hypothetical protein